MNDKIAVIGGDLRFIKLIEMFAKDNKIVYTYGLEKAEELKNKENIIFCSSIEELTKEVKTIIGPIPFSRDGININAPFSTNNITINELIKNLETKTLIAGSIKKEVYNLINNKYIHIVDIMQKEELAILNTIATVEGTIQIAISNTQTNIHGLQVLILGFGRIGKVLAQKFTALSANVTCAARNPKDIAWIETYGYKFTDINNIKENLKNYDIIINTVPKIILNKQNLKYVKKDCLLIDLASEPGGIDSKICEEENLKLIWALGLPGKVAPVTSAKYIKDTIYNILKELYIE